ncbi:MAG: hypothetical protein IPJ19_12350 [Planctomycetes bacterium]|nr:hypothetical protein [Planctomycetota bacterium]
MHIEGQIAGAEKLTAVFGYWPSFHDAEVVWIHLDRGEQMDGAGPTLEALVHTFEISRDADAIGQLALRHHVLVHLRFRRVVDLKLEDFNHQNALFGLEVTEVPDVQSAPNRFQVRLDSAYGMWASFRCRTVECVQVTPCTEDGFPMGDSSGPDDLDALDRLPST